MVAWGIPPSGDICVPTVRVPWSRLSRIKSQKGQELGTRTGLLVGVLRAPIGGSGIKCQDCLRFQLLVDIHPERQQERVQVLGSLLLT